MIKHHIDRYDYMDLLSHSGCPANEFEEEARQITESIRDDYPVCKIVEVIAKTFESAFGKQEKPEDFLELALGIKQDLDQLKNTI